MSALHSSLFRRVDRVYFLFYLQREEVLMPYIRALSTFRDGVRKVAIAKGETALKDILALCDKLRDVDLVPLGVALDDVEGKQRKANNLKLLSSHAVIDVLP